MDKDIEDCKDNIVKKVITKFLERSKIGILKYNSTLERTDFTTLDWINNAQEELMDGILYLERLKLEMKNK